MAVLATSMVSALVFCGGLFMTLLTFVYPMYQSVLAVNSKSGDDDKAWLSYWCFYALSLLWAATVGRVLECVVPLYSLWGFVYFVWLQYPVTRGSLVLYHAVLSPILQRYKPAIDRFLEMCDGQLDQVGAQLLKDKITEKKNN